jgi:hypothetical protein
MATLTGAFLFHIPACDLHVGHYPLNLLCKLTHLYPVTLLLIGYFQAKPSLICIPHLFSNLVIIYLLAHEDGTVCSETSAYKIQTPGNYPEENIQQNTKEFYFPWSCSSNSELGTQTLQ